MKFDEFLNKTPNKSIPIDAAVRDWYTGWVERRTLHPKFIRFMNQPFNGLTIESSTESLCIINAYPNEMQTVHTTITRAIGEHPSDS